MTFDDIFIEKFNNIMKFAKNKEVYFFKGFSIAQMKWISQLPNSILNNEKIFENDEINLDVIDKEWITLISNISKS